MSAEQRLMIREWQILKWLDKGVYPSTLTSSLIPCDFPWWQAPHDPKKDGEKHGHKDIDGDSRESSKEKDKWDNDKNRKGKNENESGGGGGNANGGGSEWAMMNPFLKTKKSDSGVKSDEPADQFEHVRQENFEILIAHMRWIMQYSTKVHREMEWTMEEITELDQELVKDFDFMLKTRAQLLNQQYSAG